MMRLACSVLIVAAGLITAGCTTPEETPDKGDQELSKTIDVKPNDSAEGNESGSDNIPRTSGDRSRLSKD